MRDHVRMRELPTGTVTLLFTDIEGSTRLLDHLGEGYADVLAEHRTVLRDVFSRHNGVEVDTQGEAFFVAFSRAPMRWPRRARPSATWRTGRFASGWAFTPGSRSSRRRDTILASATPDFERGREEGRNVTLDDAVSLALGEG